MNACEVQLPGWKIDPAALVANDAGATDDRSPFADFAAQERVKLIGGFGLRRHAKLGQALLDCWIAQSGIERRIELGDDRIDWP